jgi:hypothetical protein
MEIGIDLYRNRENTRQGLQFDVPRLVERLKECFPSVAFEEEIFQRQIERINKMMVDRHVGRALEAANRDAEERGPGFRFHIPGDTGADVEGSMSRYAISFRFSQDVAVDLRQKVETFLDSISVQKYTNGD